VKFRAEIAALRAKGYYTREKGREKKKEERGNTGIKNIRHYRHLDVNLISIASAP